MMIILVEVAIKFGDRYLEGYKSYTSIFILPFRVYDDTTLWRCVTSFNTLSELI